MSNPYVQVPTGVGNTIVAAQPVGLKRVIVAVTGAGTAVLYDNPSTNSGNVLVTVPANAASGTVYEFDQTVSGITVAGSSGSPVLNVTIEQF